MKTEDIADLECCFQAGDSAGGIRVAKTLISQGVSHPLIEVALSIEYSDRLQYHDALAAANRALTQDPGNSFASAARVRALFGLGHVAQAQAEADGSNVSEGDAHRHKARAAFSKEDFVTAEREASKCLEYNPTSGYAKCIALASRWLSSNDLTARLELERLFYEARSMEAGFRLSVGLQVKGEFQQAQHVLSECVRYAPSNPWPRLRLIGLLDLQGKYEEALTNIEAMPTEMRNLSATRRANIQILFGIGRLEEAERLCWELLIQAPEDMTVLILLWKILRKRSRRHRLLYAFYIALKGCVRPIGKLSRVQERKK